MPADALLSRLLSQTLVAFTIELDNEFELQLSKTWASPFKISLVMWSNFLRFVRATGTPVSEIVTRSCTPAEAVRSVVGGMERWGYISVDHDPAGGTGPIRKGFGSGRGVKADTVIYPTQVGTMSDKIFASLPEEIEGRWRSRLGDELVANLRGSLEAIESRIDRVMPHHLPIVGGSGCFTHVTVEEGRSEPDDSLATLLSRVLLAFTLEAEDGAPVSLAIGSNVLRVLDDDGGPVKELPLRTGVSKEAVSFSMSWLEKAGYTSVEPEPSGRGKRVHLTSQGKDVQRSHRERIHEIESRWEERFGTDAVGNLRAPLQAILDQPGGPDGPLSAGLVTPEGGWRGTGRYKPLTAAFIASPSDALPHHPMVLHRGGWPDGS